MMIFEQIAAQALIRPAAADPFSRLRERVGVRVLPRGQRAVTNPRDYPDEIQSAETGRPLRRCVMMLTITIGDRPFTYGQPGWWASIDDLADTEGQLTDEDNVIRAAARREARANAKHAGLTPLVIRAIREVCGLSQQEAARVFGGGPKAFEKYESGEVAPSSSMMRLLLLAAKRPELFQKGSGVPMISPADADPIRETVRKSPSIALTNESTILNSIGTTKGRDRTLALSEAALHPPTRPNPRSPGRPAPAGRAPAGRSSSSTGS